MSLTSIKAFGAACIVRAQVENPHSEEASNRVLEAFGVFGLTDAEVATVVAAVGNLAYPGLSATHLAVIIEAAVERAYFKRKLSRGTKHG